MKNVLYVATDRLYAGRMRLYGGWERYPFLERIAKRGGFIPEAVSAAASTVMCHASEWTGLYPHQHHDFGQVPNEQRRYELGIGSADGTVFTDMLDKGYDCHVVMVTKPGKYHETYKQVHQLWEHRGVKVHLVPDWDQPGGEGKTRLDHLRVATAAIAASNQAGRRAFVWLKIHGFFKHKTLKGEVLDLLAVNHREVEGTPVLHRDHAWNLQVDRSLKSLVETGELDLASTELFFASDHGSFQGQYGLRGYGYHLRQEIVHVPVICSMPLTACDGPVSMRTVRSMISGRDMTKERYVFSETMYPGQVPDGNNPKHDHMKTMIRKGPWKLIWSPGRKLISNTSNVELYDLRIDPHEKHNLADRDDQFIDRMRGVSCGRRDWFMRYPEGPLDPGGELDGMEWRLQSGKSKPLQENSYALAGWDQVDDIEAELLEQVRQLYKRTGREAWMPR